MKQAQKFLEDREQVKVIVQLRGRQKWNPDAAVTLLKEIHETYFADLGNLVKEPTKDSLFLTYNPRKK